MKPKFLLLIALLPLAAAAQYLPTSLGLSNTIPIIATNSYSVASSNYLDMTRYTHAAFEFNGSGQNTNTNTLILTLTKSLGKTNWQTFTNWSITINGTNRTYSYMEFDFGVFGWGRLETVGSSLTNTITNASLNAWTKGYRREQ